MATDLTTHASDLLAHEAHHKIGQAMGEYYAADEALHARPVGYTARRDAANDTLHEVQCMLFELKSRTPLSGAKRRPLPQRAGGSVWTAILVGFVIGLLWRYRFPALQSALFRL